MFVHEHTITSGSRHVGAFAGYAWNLRFNNCHSRHNTIIGMDHVGGFMGEYETSFFTDCSSEKNTVLAFGGHSGAFASCSNSWGEFVRCWSNSDIYGNSNVGGFTSGCDGGSTGSASTQSRGAVYRDCFSSGVVEGNENIGGFIGFTYTYDVYDSKPERLPIYERCYSTSMVGMNYNGKNLGGFVGSMRTGTFISCYAAGEVGSIDTTTDNTNHIGGFAGELNDGTFALGAAKYSVPVIDHCFYDMQTTAMKNRGVGNAPAFPIHRDSKGLYTDYYKNILGFSTKKMTGACNIFTSEYVYQDGLYPQLAAMASHVDTKFRAQSAASTATAFCDDWSDITQTGFDTVRDTMRNYCFSSNESFGTSNRFAAAQVTSQNVKNIRWTTDGNVSPVDRKTPVIQLAENPYYSVSIAPGIEWMEISLDYITSDGLTATGTRRLRLIPTSLIEAGGDKRVDIFYDDNLNETNPYDHKEGFATTYIDAPTLQSYLESDTAHTEALQTFADISNQQYDNGVITGTANLPFNSSVKNLAVTATMTDTEGNRTSIDNLYEKLNGIRRFENKDCGIYKIVYKAALADGRYLSIGKKLIVVGPWSVVYNYNYVGLLDDEKIAPDSVFYIQSNLLGFDDFLFTSYETPPRRVGYEFAYWSLDRAGMHPVTQEWFDAYEDRYGALDKNIDVYAQWNKNANEYVLVIDPDIGSYGTKETGQLTNVRGSTGDKVIISTATPPYRYLFNTWSDDELGGGNISYDEDTDLYVFTFGTANAMITAKYDLITYTVKWIDDHTGEVVAEQSVVMDDSAAPPDLPSHSGYAFAGYDTDAWKEVKEDLIVRILYDWDTIAMPETGSDGMYGMVLFAIVGTCVASCLGAAALMAFTLKHN